jgi:hypothetical protein
MGSEDATRVSSFQTPGTMQTNVVGNTAFSTYNPGIRDTVVKPGADVMVRFCKQEKSNPCSGMLPADEVINNLGPRYYQSN